MSLRPTYPDARRKRKHFATVIRCSGGSDGKLCGRQTTTCGHETTRTATGWDLTLRGRGSSLRALILSLAWQFNRHLIAVWLTSASVFSQPRRSEAGGCPAGMQEDTMNQEKLPSWARLAWRGLTRRGFIHSAAGAGAGLVLGSKIGVPAWADEAAHPFCPAVPRPIPHITGPGHFFFPGRVEGAPASDPNFPNAGHDPSIITDFSGVIAQAARQGRAPRHHRVHMIGQSGGDCCNPPWQPVGLPLL